MTTEDKVQQLTANCLRDQLGWQSVYAYNQEDYGENSLLGRQNQKEVILKRYIKQKLREFNPNLPEEAYKSAILQIEEIKVPRPPGARPCIDLQGPDHARSSHQRRAALPARGSGSRLGLRLID
jgi:hypothetical protein